MWIFKGIMTGNSSSIPQVSIPIFAKAIALWEKWLQVTRNFKKFWFRILYFLASIFLILSPNFSKIFSVIFQQFLFQRTRMHTFCNNPDTNLVAVLKKWDPSKCFIWMKNKECSKEFYQKWLLNVANVVEKKLSKRKKKIKPCPHFFLSISIFTGV